MNSPLNYSGSLKWTRTATSRLFIEVGQSMDASTYHWEYQPEIGIFEVAKTQQLSTGITRNASVYCASRELQPELQHGGERLVRDRLACDQHGREPDVRVTACTRGGAARRHGACEFPEQRRASRPRARWTIRNSPVTAREELNAGSRALRAGQVDPQAPHYHGGRAVRLPERVHARSVGAGWTVRAGPLEAAAHRLPALLVGLVGPPRRRLRSFRERQDGAQSVGRQVPGVHDAGPRGGIRTRSAASPRHARGWTSTGTARRSTQTEVRSTTKSDRAHQRQLRPAKRRDAVRSRVRRVRPTGKTTVSVQHELMPGFSMTGGYYHRDFQNLTITQKPAGRSGRWTTRRSPSSAPRDPRLPGRRRRSDHAVQPGAEASWARWTRSRTYLDGEHARVRRRRSQRARPAA